MFVFKVFFDWRAFDERIYEGGYLGYFVKGDGICTVLYVLYVSWIEKRRSGGGKEVAILPFHRIN